jgi:putative FmdB family regulatory protein
MPIYEYKCTSCGHKKEVLQKMSDAPLTQCPACGKATLSKLISAAGFQLKGSGWYATDFKGGSGSPKSGTEKGDTKAKDEVKATDTSGASSPEKPKVETKTEVPASGAGVASASQ